MIGYPINDFIHVTLRVLSGRNQQQKKGLSERMLGKLDNLGLTSVSLTVEMIDMDRETYAEK